MILLHSVLFISVLAPILSAPDLSNALARLNEARARALSNRARIRANTARISSRLHTSTPSTRSKRQQVPEGYAGIVPPQSPPLPLPYPNYYEEEEPTLVHICSVEDDEYDGGYARSAEGVFPRTSGDIKSGIPRFASEAARKEEAEVREATARSAPNEDSLIRARDDLQEVKEILNNIEEEHMRHSESEFQHQNGLVHKHSEQTGPHEMMQRLRNNFEEEEREADAHIHSHHKVHTHQKIHSHGSSVFPQTSIVTPGLHVPQTHGATIPYTQVLTPGLNVNLNRGFHSGLPHSGIVNHGVISTHGQPIFHSRHSEHDHLEKDAEADPFFSFGFGNHPLPVPQTSVTPTSHVPQAHITNLHNTVINKGVLPSHDAAISTQTIPHLRDSENRALEKDAEADPLFSFGFGNHPPVAQTSVTPTSHVPQTHVTSGFHLPQAHIVAPGLNFNVHQPELHPGLHSSTVVNKGVFSAVSTQAIPHLRDSENEALEKDAEAEASGFNRRKGPKQISGQLNNHHNQQMHHGGSIMDQGHGINQNLRPINQNRPDINNNFHLVNENIPNFNRGQSGNRWREASDEDEAGKNKEDVVSTAVDAREASPTLHKKMKLKQKLQPMYYPQYPSYNQYHSQYREEEEEEETDDNSAAEDEDMAVPDSFDDREAKPTVEKSKPQYYQTYKEAEEDEIEPMIEDILADVTEAREANPTLKKLKQKKMMAQYYPSYPSYYPAQYYGKNFGPYREAMENSQNDEEAREASPTLKKLKQKKMMAQYYQPYPSYNPAQYYQSYPSYKPVQHYGKNFGPYREAEESGEEIHQSDEKISSPYLFDVPSRFSDQFKRSINEELDSILGTQHQLVDTLHEKAGNDEDMKFITDIGNRTLAAVEQRRNISKRSLPLTRLISDPRVKLDVPQTIENFGTATKNAFEDERAPMYHFKHLVGSSKNALLSAMKIPPQNMIIPADYEIVKSSDRVGAVNPSFSEEPFDNTFRRVGQMVRNSIKSSQETASHLGEMAHSAKNILNSARHSAPRLIAPYAQIPAIQDTRKKRPNKAILITPRIVDLAHETVGKKPADTRPNFIHLGHLMDAVGISKPNSKSLELQKIVFEPRGINAAHVDKRLAQLYSKFSDRYHDVDTVSEALSTLEDAKISVGAKNLRDFLVKMKNELTDVVRNTPDSHRKKKFKSHNMKKQETKEMGRFIETLFDSSTIQRKKEENHESKEEVVGERMFLSPELMHPFMGRATENEVRNFLRDNGDEEVDKMDNTLEPHVENRLKSPKNRFEESRNHVSHNQNDSDLGYVLGAINPLMFERLYNETVTVRDKEDPDPQDMFQRNPKTAEDNATVGTSFVLNGPMLKPFMGQASEPDVEKFLDTYNKDNNSDFVGTDD